MKTLIVLALIVLAGCSDNANLLPQLSQATSEADSHTGVILYSGYSFQLVRVKIAGVNYIANTRGGLIVEGCKP